jgi:hypothetical protein
MRALVALLAAPIIPSFVTAWFAYANRTMHPSSVFIPIWGVFFILQLPVGIPGCKYIASKRRHRVWVYLFLGFLGPAIPFVLLCLYRWSEKGYHVLDVSYLTCYVGFLGACTGLSFWLIARPDKKIA